MNKLFNFIIIYTIFITSCKGQADKAKCIDDLIEKNQGNRQYQEMLSEISDSISVWSNKKLKNTSGYLIENSTWKVDAFLFNNDSSKIFGWILRIDKEKDIPIHDDRDDILDFVDFFSGEKINGQWYYYIHNMPKKWFSRKDNKDKAYSFNQLTAFAKKEIIDGGIIYDNSCAINYDYINGWINREGRKMHEWHKLFLKGQQ